MTVYHNIPYLLLLTRVIEGRTQFFFCMSLFNMSSNLLLGGVDVLEDCVTFWLGLFLNGMEKSWTSFTEESLGPELKSIHPDCCCPPL